jgi:hypothetical protein
MPSTCQFSKLIINNIAVELIMLLYLFIYADGTAYLLVLSIY